VVWHLFGSVWGGRASERAASHRNDGDVVPLLRLMMMMMKLSYH
jgi:hypothetical protein